MFKIGFTMINNEFNEKLKIYIYVIPMLLEHMISYKVSKGKNCRKIWSTNVEWKKMLKLKILKCVTISTCSRQQRHNLSIALISTVDIKWQTPLLHQKIYIK